MRYIVDVNKKTYKELIECKKCKYYRDAYNDWDICSLYDKPRNENDFCSRAKYDEKKDKKEVFK